MNDAAPRFLALGDSYTIGEGVAADRRWPQRLVQDLHSQGITLGDPQVIAVTGWTTAQLAAAMDAATLQPPYELVTLLIGVNDQYQGGTPGDYRPAFTDLLQRAIALAGDAAARVIVISIPDWGVTRFARENGRDPQRIAAEIDTFNAIARDETARAGAHWVDVTGISREAGDHVGMLASDGLHPSATQYAQWVERIAPVAREVLRKRATMPAKPHL